MSRSGSTILCFILALLTASVDAEDWPRFRGANGLGVSSSEKLPTEFGPDKNVIWKVDCQDGSSSPIICNGKLFLASFDAESRTVRCLDAATGKEIWKQSVKKVRDETASRLNGPATCTPVTDGTNVVAFFPDAGLFCYSTDGDLRWQAEVGPFHSMHGISNSPIIVGDKVILLADQLKGSFLAAYNIETGKVAWQVERLDGLTGGYSTPTVLQLKGGEPLIVTSGPEGLAAYKLESGETAFVVPGVTNAPVTLPLVAANQIFLCEPVGTTEPISRMLPMFDTNKDGNISLKEAEKSASMHRMLERLDQKWGNGDGIIDEAEWDKAFGSFVDKGGLVAVGLDESGDSIDATVRWNYRKTVPYVASPLVYDGVLYFIQDTGILTSVAPETGDVLKRGRLKKGGRQFYASPVAADGKIFVVDTAGQMTVLKSGAEWQELATTSLEEQCFSTPAICNDRLFVRTKSKLYCFGQ